MTQPQINSVTITPNPVNASTSFKITIEVTEAEVVSYIVSQILGTFSTGQASNINTHKELSE